MTITVYFSVTAPDIIVALWPLSDLQLECTDLQDFKISLMISFTNHKIPNIPAMNLWLTLAMMIADLSYPDDLQYDSKSLTCCHCTLGVSRCNFLVSNFQI